MKSNIVLVGLIVMSLITVLTAGMLYHNTMSRHEAGAKQKIESKDVATSNQTLQEENVQQNTGVSKVIPFERLVVNLRGDNGRRILVLNYEIKVLIQNDYFFQELDNKKVVLRDAVISIVSNTDYNDIINMAGRSTIKKQIIDNFNAVIKNANASDVFFTQFETN
jgi:flagellar basal body-associated protein FliL